MEEKETIVEQEEQESMSPEEVLVKMKETMVPKEEANKWQKKYNDLFQRVANGTFSGEDKVIDIVVPTKMSQLVNDSSYITRDDLTEELVEEIKKDIEEELGGEIETTNHKVQVITEEGSEVDYPSTKAVVDYLNSHILSEEDINEIINAHSA